MQLLTTSVCESRGSKKGRGRAVFCPQVLSKQFLKPLWTRRKQEQRASLEDNVAGQGIKAARGTKVHGQDRVSVRQEAPSECVGGQAII